MLRRRLANQQLIDSNQKDPAGVVAWLGAVQAQDYPAAKWALGLRTSGITDADVDEAFNAGRILRTHVLRPTWHFVSPADIRWLLALSGPRLDARCAPQYRKLELDAATLARCRRTIARALEGGRFSTRAELSAALNEAGVPARGQRLAYVMAHAEFTGTICSGPRRGAQFTYALLDERAPRGTMLDRDEALAILARRYFKSHGPATLKDYRWWSGLTMRDVKRGCEVIRDDLEAETAGDDTFWSVDGGPRRGRGQSRDPANARAGRGRRPATATYLLPNYDEYLIAYTGRGPVVGPPRGRSDAFPHHVVIDGRLAGCWRRTLRAGSVVVSVAPYGRIGRERSDDLRAAAERYSRFLGTPLILERTRRERR